MHQPRSGGASRSLVCPVSHCQAAGPDCRCCNARRSASDLVTIQSSKLAIDRLPSSTAHSVSSSQVRGSKTTVNFPCFDIAKSPLQTMLNGAANTEQRTAFCGTEIFKNSRGKLRLGGKSARERCVAPTPGIPPGDPNPAYWRQRSRPTRVERPTTSKLSKLRAHKASAPSQMPRNRVRDFAGACSRLSGYAASLDANGERCGFLRSTSRSRTRRVPRHPPWQRPAIPCRQNDKKRQRAEHLRRPGPSNFARYPLCNPAACSTAS